MLTIPIGTKNGLIKEKHIIHAEQKNRFEKKTK